MAEQRTVNPRVVGSSPTLGAMSNEYEATIRDMQTSIDQYEKQLSTWMRTSEKYSIDAMESRLERDKYLSILVDIKNAIDNAGPVPKYHNHIIRKHRSEWPTLWKAIDRALNIFSDDENDGHEIYNKNFGCVLWCEKCRLEDEHSNN